MSARPTPLELEVERLRAEEATPPALVRHPLGDLQHPDSHPQQFVIDPLAPCQFVTLGGGHGGSGKSTILGVIAGAHVADGKPLFGFPVMQGRVLFVSLEDPARLIRARLRRAVAAYRLDPVRVANYFEIVAPPDGGDAVLATEQSEFGATRLVWTATYEELEEMAKGCVLIVVDNSSDAYDGNENNRRLVRAFLQKLTRLAAANNAALILLAHIDKAAARNGGGDDNYSGSTAWNNTPRSRLVLKPDKKSGVVSLVQEKLNVGKKFTGSIPLSWSDHLDTFMPTDAPPEGSTIGTDADAVLQAFRDAAESGVEVGTGRRGQGNTHAVLRTFPSLPAHLQNDPGPFWVAIEILRQSGEIRPENARTGQRKDRMVWRVSCALTSPPYPLTGTGAPVVASPNQLIDSGAQSAQIGAIGADVGPSGAR